MGEMDELVGEFIAESYENLDRLDQDFVALEVDPTATDRLKSIFRTIHTIKGTSGCLAYGKLEGVAHVGENLLSRLRDGELVMDTAITTGLLKLVDAVREILRNIETVGNEGDQEYADVKAELIRLNERPGVGKEPSTTAAPPLGSSPATTIIEVEAEPVAEHVESAHVEAAHIEPAPEVAAPVEGAAKEKSNAPDAASAGIRVDVNLLDKLMNLVGELVLARNQVLQYTASQKDATFLRTAQRLNLITSELQEGVMKTRMQPIGNLWNKFPRIVRDVASACGKKIRLEMEGKDTELDKTIIEAIKDPLTHVIRNSVDHGVESPDKRRASGKNEEGRLFMRAFHEGGQVNIEISDDGKGIDPEVIKRKALEKGLITADQAARMGDREAVGLIFLPGFSTADKITNVSGRGVGMDVVKTNIEKIGGVVDVTSRIGLGTTLRIKIPLTLAIIPALIVTTGGERFAIPQVSLLELVRIDDDETGIEMVGGTPLYRLRGNLLPLVYLNRELKIENLARKPGGSANIVVLRSGERQFGLVVDSINDTEEIVVKPLGKQLKCLSVFAGATIMGDGKVALILDVMGVAQRAHVVSLAAEAAKHGRDDENAVAGKDTQALLLFRINGQQTMGIPLSFVARLEEFPRNAVEDAGGQYVVQYRGRVMPVISIAEMVGDRRARARAHRVRKDKIETDTIQVIVHSHDGQDVGLRVEQILDIVDQRVDLQETIHRPGVIGTAIIREKVTEMLDVPAIVRAAFDAEPAFKDVGLRLQEAA